MCVIKKSECEPPTRNDLKVKVGQNSLPVNIIMDGKLMLENVKMAGLSSANINECLDKAKIKKIEDVLILTIDNNGEVFIQEKRAEQCFSFNINFSGGDKW